MGKVLECEKVPKADKLLKFKIDDGMGGRTIVSGIAKFYQPEELVGKEVCFIANFAPRKLKGVESQGMILSAQDADGRLVVISLREKFVRGAALADHSDCVAVSSESSPLSGGAGARWPRLDKAWSLSNELY